jgi:hypothetical protein
MAGAAVRGGAAVMVGEVEDTLLSVVVTAAGEELGAERAQLAVEAVGVRAEAAEWEAAHERPE